ncbi:MAG: STAS/SEC14 domain-containing protein [Parafilimonas sp.]
MINLKNIKGKDIYTFSIDGKITKEDVKEIFALLEEKAKQNSKIKILGVINKFPDFKDLKEVGETIKIRLNAQNGIGKYAILTNAHRIKAIIPIGNLLTPRIPIKAFHLDEKDKAIEWLEGDEEAEEFKKQISLLEKKNQLTDTEIYNITIDGKLTEEQIIYLYGYVRSLPKKRRIKILLDIKNFKGIANMHALLSGTKEDYGIIANIKKYAVLTEEEWIKNLCELFDSLMSGLSIRVFSHRNKNDAISWLKEDKD